MTDLAGSSRLSQYWAFVLLTFSSMSVSWANDPAWVSHATESLDGTRIAYYRRGTLSRASTPLLVVSGGPGSDHRYLRVGGGFERLAKDRAVIMFDQRGTSESGPVTGTPKLVDWTGDVEAIRSELGVRKIHLLGHSFGGLVGMDYARRHGKYLQSLILVGAPAPRLGDTQQLMGSLFPDRIEEWQNTRAALTPRFRGSEIAMFTAMEFVNPAAAARFMKVVADYVYNIEVNNALRPDLAAQDFSGLIENLETPVFLLHGRFDAIISPSTAWATHQIARNSRIQFIEAAGHLPFAERPDAFAAAVAGFLAEVEGKP